MNTFQPKLLFHALPSSNWIVSFISHHSFKVFFNIVWLVQSASSCQIEFFYTRTCRTNESSGPSLVVSLCKPEGLSVCRRKEHRILRFWYTGIWVLCIVGWSSLTAEWPTVISRPFSFVVLLRLVSRSRLGDLLLVRDLISSVVLLRQVSSLSSWVAKFLQLISAWSLNFYSRRSI